MFNVKQLNFFPFGSPNQRPKRLSASQLTPGMILNEQRLKREHTVEYVESQLHVPAAVLRALEEDQWDQLPGEVNTRDILRTYARFLAIDPNKLIRLRRESAGQVNSKGAASWHYAIKMLATALLISLIFGIGLLFWNRVLLSNTIDQQVPVAGTPQSQQDGVALILSPTFTSTSSPTSAAPTNTIEPTSTPAPTDTPMPTSTSVPTVTQVPTNTPISVDTPTHTPIPWPTFTPVPTNTAWPTFTPAPTHTATPAFVAADCSNLNTTITWPRQQEVISGKIKISGSVSLTDLNFYKLEYATDYAPQDFIYIDGGKSNVSDGVLGNFNTIVLADGTYVVRAVAVDKNRELPGAVFGYCYRSKSVTEMRTNFERSVCTCSEIGTS